MKEFFSLENKTILVTGASSGIGRQIAIDISEMGANVIAFGRNEKELEQTISQLKGDKNLSFIVDLTDYNKLFCLYDKIPALDGIVYSAGIVKYIPFKMVKYDQLNNIQNINMNSPLIMTQGLLKHKKINENSSLVFISSIMAMIGVRGGGIYSGTKAGMIGMARVLALELAHLGIRVNCIAPGMVKTPMATRVENTVSAALFEEHSKLYPLGLGTAEDVSNTTIFLLSNASRWITGQTIILDGGYTCQ